MQGAEFGDGLGVHGLDLVLLGDVGLHHDSLAAETFDLMGHFLGRFRMGHVVDRDIGAGLGEAERHRLADPRVGAGHEGGLTDQHLMVRDLGNPARVELGRLGGFVLGGLGVAHHHHPRAAGGTAPPRRLLNDPWRDPFRRISADTL